ncbi:MAG TPA: BTAD domain-containing putative transcriptional regulator [Propionicimonas sp.]
MTVSAKPELVELNLIGGFELCRNGKPVTLAPSSQRLVAFLALQSRPVPRAHASATLWPDVDPRHASASLRSALWRLSPLEIVRSSSTHAWLNPCVRADLNHLMQRSLHVLTAQPSSDMLLTLAQDLIDLGDDLLSEWDDEWVVGERERLRQIRLQAMDRIGEELIDSGRCYDALQVALAATRAEPLRESAHRVLVRVHLRQGNVAEAVREYRRYAELLREELGGRPSQIMRDLLAPFLRPAPA